MRDEIADVQLYLIRLAGKLNVDIKAACRAKMQLLFPPARTQPHRVKALAEHLVETFAALTPLPRKR